MTNSLVLIDTSVWVLALRKSPSKPLRGEVDHLLAENRVAIVPMIQLELLGGTKSIGEFDRLRSRLSALHQIPMDDTCWETAARLSFSLRQRGKIIPYTDILIGSAAMLTNALLLHADRHFDLMAEDSELKVRSLISLVKR
jgi:hypothetical protein